MNADANKNISSIQYNYLNLPSVITVTGKGTISYVYDAVGNKIQKVVAETGQPTKTTLYLGGAVYENDVMQFTGHEEGRIRFSPAAGAQPNALYYDYMLKDHLGNVRMVLTEEVQTNAYPVASMESAQEANESLFYTNINSTIRSTKPANYPADSYTSPNQYAAKLRGDAGTTKIGPAILLKVMAGDKFNLRVNSWWSYGGGGSLNAPNPLTELASVLANGIAGASGGKVTAIDLNNSGLTSTAATSFLSTQNGALTTRPRAFVNWVLLDENFNIAKDSAGGYIRDGYSNFQQVGDEDAFTTHSLVNAPINKNGYLYIYVSNQTPNMDVYFDNLQVTHIKEPILEENHYSPWGMTLAALSSKAISTAAENKHKYNNKELESREFSDGTGLESIDFDARIYNMQLGRWQALDPLADFMNSWSPYNFCFNNPFNFIDPNGMEPTSLADETLSESLTNADKRSKKRRGTVAAYSETIESSNARIEANSFLSAAMSKMRKILEFPLFYETPEAAAIGWTHFFAPISIRFNAELMSIIFEKGGYYSFNIPITPMGKSAKLYSIEEIDNQVKNVPNSARIVAWIHSHGAYDPLYQRAGEEFSEKDVQRNYLLGVDAYHHKPSGFLTVRRQSSGGNRGDITISTNTPCDPLSSTTLPDRRVYYENFEYPGKVDGDPAWIKYRPSRNLDPIKKKKNR